MNNVPKDIKRKLLDLPNDYGVRLLDLNEELNISKDYFYFKDYGHLNMAGDSLVNDFFSKNEIQE